MGAVQFHGVRYLELFVALFLSSSSGAWAGELSDKDAAFEMVYQAVNAVDWAQTRSIAREASRWEEANPVLGLHPSVSQVDRYFLASALLHVGVVYVLPSSWRGWFQSFSLAFEGAVVVRNFNLGISARF